MSPKPTVVKMVRIWTAEATWPRFWDWFLPWEPENRWGNEENIGIQHDIFMMDRWNHMNIYIYMYIYIDHIWNCFRKYETNIWRIVIIESSSKCIYVILGYPVKSVGFWDRYGKWVQDRHNPAEQVLSPWERYQAMKIVHQIWIIWYVLRF